VSRGDLVRALAAATPAPPASRSDAELVREMRARLRREPWTTTLGVVVEARDGIVSLWGLVSTDVERSAIETMARAVPGVRGIESHLVVRAAVPYVYGV
jgi:osmotically-inducible protein OsmY